MGTGEVVLAGVGAFVGGGLGVIVAPWTQWAVDKKRATTEHRRILLQSWRQGVARYVAEHSREGRTLGPRAEQLLIELDWYQSLAGKLRPKVRAEAEDPRSRVTPVVVASDYSSIRPVTRAEVLRDEIDRIAREWGLD